MRKVLLVALFIGIAMQVAPPIPGQQTRAASNSSDRTAKKRQGDQSAAKPPATLPALQPDDSSKKGNGVAPKDTEYSVKLTGSPVVSIADKNKTTWDYIFDWGPWFFNLLLVAVGIVGAILAYRTIGLVDRQTTAMQMQATLMERQTDLMAAQFYQCVYLTNWRVKRLQANAFQRHDFKVTVDLTNQSSFPITLSTGFISVSETGGSNTYSISQRTFLPPAIPMTIEIPINTTAQQTIHYDEWGTLDFPVEGAFSFFDRIDGDKTITQLFSGRLYCGKKWGANFEWHLHMNPEPQNAGEQAGDGETAI